MTIVLHSMPAIVRSLREPWTSLVGEIPHLTEKMEASFRFGHRVHHTPRGYLMGGNIKGGSSGVWRGCAVEEYQAYQEWRGREGILNTSSLEYFDKLCHLLDAHNIKLTYGEEFRASGNAPALRERCGQVYQLTYEVLRNLPVSHLERDTFSRLQLGGWGPDSAKASAYQDGVVMMYNFALHGARRTYVGLLLHELGHAHEQSIEPHVKDHLAECYNTICRYNAFVGMEYLANVESRRVYQSFQLEEFLAETYLAYAALGRTLVRWKEDLPSECQEAWREVYQFFRDTFDGFTYR